MNLVSETMAIIAEDVTGITVENVEGKCEKTIRM
jgi:hypothetical protein